MEAPSHGDCSVSKVSYIFFTTRFRSYGLITWGRLTHSALSTLAKDNLTCLTVFRTVPSYATFSSYSAGALSHFAFGRTAHKVLLDLTVSS